MAQSFTQLVLPVPATDPTRTRHAMRRINEELANIFSCLSSGDSQEKLSFLWRTRLAWVERVVW